MAFKDFTTFAAASQAIFCIYYFYVILCKFGDLMQKTGNWKYSYNLFCDEISDRALKPEEILEVFKISLKMKKEGSPTDLIAKNALAIINHDRWKAFFLMKIWNGEESKGQKNDIFAEMMKVLSDVSNPKSIFIPFDRLELILKYIVPFKEALRIYIDNEGGISEFCEKTEKNKDKEDRINQSSLSRFLRYHAKPKIAFMRKLSKAIGGNGIEVSISGD